MPILKGSKFIIFFVLAAAFIMVNNGGFSPFNKIAVTLITPFPQQSVQGIADINVSKSAEINTYFVSRVVDGDTIKLSNGKTVRYIGVNTPETVDPRRPVGCFGKEASAKNKELVLGKTVRLEKDVSETDKYGRLLRYVYIEGTGSAQVFVNDYLVRQGYAYAVSYPPDIKYQNIFQRSQAFARSQNKGLWSAC